MPFNSLSQQLLRARACVHERRTKFGKDLAILTSASLGKRKKIRALLKMAENLYLSTWRRKERTSLGASTI